MSKIYHIDGYRVSVNAHDYDCGIVIEDVDSQCVWAWDERGLPDLVGPFVSIQAAITVLEYLSN